MSLFSPKARFKLRAIPIEDASEGQSEQLELMYTVVDDIETMMIFRFRDQIPTKQAMMVIESTKKIFSLNRCVFLPHFVEMISLEPENLAAHTLLTDEDVWHIVHVHEDPKGFLVRSNEWDYGVIVDITDDEYKTAYHRMVEEGDSSVGWKDVDRIHILKAQDLIEWGVHIGKR